MAIARSVTRFRGRVKPKVPTTIPALGSGGADKAAWGFPIAILAVMIGGAAVLTKREGEQRASVAAAKTRGYGYYTGG